MSTKSPEGWNEPIVEGLWQYETLFGAPRFMLLVYLPLFMLGVFYSKWYFVATGGVQGVAALATLKEPEWPRIAIALLFEPGEIEP